MQHTLRFHDNDTILLEEHTLAYGLTCGYERGAAELGVPAGRQVRMELLDDTGRLLDWRTYQVSVTGGHFPALLPEHPTWSVHPDELHRPKPVVAKEWDCRSRGMDGAVLVVEVASAEIDGVEARAFVGWGWQRHVRRPPRRKR